MRIICSAGGSGGHIFPAVAVAQNIKEKYPNAEVLFIGAIGRMEMEKVPKAGFFIKGLWISGFQRSLTFKNILFPIKLLVSIVGAWNIIRRFKPDAVAGFGGYASGATLWVAAKMGLPTLIMEQNSYPGITNRLLNGSADVACIAYEESKKYFDKSKVVITGNPIRSDLSKDVSRDKAISSFDLDLSKKTILIVGGSQGAGSINKAIADDASLLKESLNVQLIWQCGAGYYDQYKNSDSAKLSHVQISAFIQDMRWAYAACDLVICRAGALTIAEIMHLGKPAILVPSPNVAADHQTKNAKSLVEQEACVLIKDQNVEDLLKSAIELLEDEDRLKTMSNNVKALASPDAAGKIVEELEMLIRK